MMPNIITVSVYVMLFSDMFNRLFKLSMLLRLYLLVNRELCASELVLANCDYSIIGLLDNGGLMPNVSTYIFMAFVSLLNALIGVQNNISIFFFNQKCSSVFPSLALPSQCVIGYDMRGACQSSHIRFLSSPSCLADKSYYKYVDYTIVIGFLTWRLSHSSCL